MNNKQQHQHSCYHWYITNIASFQLKPVHTTTASKNPPIKPLQNQRKNTINHPTIEHFCEGQWHTFHYISINENNGKNGSKMRCVKAVHNEIELPSQVRSYISIDTGSELTCPVWVLKASKHRNSVSHLNLQYYNSSYTNKE